MDANKLRIAIEQDTDDPHRNLRLWLLQYAVNGRLLDVVDAAKIHIDRLRQFMQKSDDPLKLELDRLRIAYDKLEQPLKFNDPD